MACNYKGVLPVGLTLGAIDGCGIPEKCRRQEQEALVLAVLK